MYLEHKDLVEFVWQKCFGGRASGTKGYDEACGSGIPTLSNLPGSWRLFRSGTLRLNPVNWEKYRELLSFLRTTGE